MEALFKKHCKEVSDMVEKLYPTELPCANINGVVWEPYDLQTIGERGGNYYTSDEVNSVVPSNGLILPTMYSFELLTHNTHICNIIYKDKLGLMVVDKSNYKNLLFFPFNGLIMGHTVDNKLKKGDKLDEGKRAYYWSSSFMKGSSSLRREITMEDVSIQNFGASGCEHSFSARLIKK